MRLSSLLILFVTFATAGLLSLVAASLSADLIEDTSRTTVEHELSKSGMDWAEVHAEGLQIFLAGVAPSEADRFKAISAAGRIVDAARVIDNMEVPATAAIAPPRFSVEILRNDAGISLIGLIPRSADRDRMLRELKNISANGEVADLLETADYAAPSGWSSATRFAIAALKDLPRSKISVKAGRVDVTAMADSPEERAELEIDLTRRAPTGLEIHLNISAPRPVITPFTLRFLVDEDGARFDACSADTDKARARILTAARSAGLTGNTECVIGLGVPSTRWADAVAASMRGLSELGGGTLTISDADITLTAQMGTDQALFDRVVGELEGTLPEAFALLAILTPTPEADDDGAVAQEFTATLSPEGLVQLRGRLPNDIARDTTDAYARARFGTETVHMATRLDETLPPTWPFRVMAGLDALSMLNNGSLLVTPESVSITGKTGNTETNARIAQLLAAKLSQTDHFAINVTYVEALDPLAGLPTNEECMANIQTLQDETKIAFEPGKGTLDASAAAIIDKLAEELNACPDLQIEIQGHTDSQGRESMNQALSQTRALAVLTALQDRRVLTKGFLALGYGESQPIADNDTAEGREANRRIEFVRIVPEEEQSEAVTEATAETSAGEAAATEAEAEAATTEGAAEGGTAVSEATAEDATETAPEDAATPATEDTPSSAVSDAAATTEADAATTDTAEDAATETPTDNAAPQDGAEDETNDQN
ncbi:OmpA family protein [Shimia sagamensis]|uniref:OmpA-OmpF porin, OOP family n=1 Tax=Shimia sagamensis TaxID=1566352 RepID=A0ABY1NYK1_9RHOB|nr:OmpA family protein [Shimia sagamensis]SMP20204.1 OmpA-OmpF porin, OOP family [Shimia sagamensis]